MQNLYRIVKRQRYLQMSEALQATMCIIHKGFRGFGAVSPASILCCNLIGLKHAIPYEIIHSTFGRNQSRPLILG
jgi:hypothetical protein